MPRSSRSSASRTRRSACASAGARVAVSNLIRLLDLPDEALELLDAGALSAGHGRALLTATDHGVRRQLAKRAAQEGWSVRELEAQARAANDEAPAAPRRRAEIHPDQLEACATIGEAFSATLGADVRVAVGRGGGYRVEMAFPSAAEALAMAERISLG